MLRERLRFCESGGADFSIGVKVVSNLEFLCREFGPRPKISIGFYPGESLCE
jgi:hypothetical protein